MSKHDKIGRYIAFVLRHKPDAAGIVLDAHGWASTDQLVQAIQKHVDSECTLETLEDVVRTDSKGRYAFSRDHSHIRANQGHSVNVDVELEELQPPDFLYHGTATKYVSSIDKQGLIPKSRLYVHLSTTTETAKDVGKRHGAPVIYTIHAKRMFDEGHKFFKSSNGVWLTKNVPTKYLVQKDVL